MYQQDDPKVIENARKRREWEDAHPDRDWKTNLTQREINDLADEMGEPEFKKEDPYDDMQRYLIESEQIKVDDDPLDNIPFPSNKTELPK